MSDEKYLPAILEPNNRSKLLRLVEQAGKYGLTPVQTAMTLGITENEYQMLLYSDSEITQRFQTAKVDEMISHLNTIKSIANDSDPENKQRFSAAKYLYELLSGRKTQFNTLVAIQNVQAPHND